MKKRYRAVSAAVMAVMAAIFSLALAGCSERLSVDEYYDSVYSGFTNWMNVQSKIVFYIASTDEEFMREMSEAWDESDPGSREDFEKNCEEGLGVLNEFKKIKPPEKYDDLHKKLIEGAETEKDWIAVIKELDKTDDAQKREELLTEIQELADSGGLPSAFRDLFIELRGDPELSPEKLE